METGKKFEKMKQFDTFWPEKDLLLPTRIISNYSIIWLY